MRKYLEHKTATGLLHCGSATIVKDLTSSAEATLVWSKVEQIFETLEGVLCAQLSWSNSVPVLQVL